ncbi:ThiF family adenylyltransferase (plasmid) [Rhizobium sp. CB3060]|uniref:ThiF family adenylyltransferase n=1 Tax=Rhizobium sp. CB3060 TaxID=3138255 RepID=UPI0021A70D1C|nr:ThiF family adenylyltransferase [Rhizobium tropici]UWU25438.1 ThiF family adenylyltransferase [Rhizobium tropici]
MSQQLISLSPDLARLRDEGYEVSIEFGHLVMRHIPYVSADRTVKFGILVSSLALSGDRTVVPNTHVVMFAGSYPCDQNGSPLLKISHFSQRQVIGDGLAIDHGFSSKPAGGYPDYHAKMSTYAAIISSPAEAIDPSVTARTRRVIETNDDSPFVYMDNASGRAGITALTRKLREQSVAIVGLGGTGSYLLDLLAKTPVKQIHLYDGDEFEQHNAFRSPGAASIECLRERPRKVDYLQDIYTKMHRHIVVHPEYITPENVGQLAQHSMVFLCIDANEIKRSIVAGMEASGVPFIDVGMGLQLVDDKLVGTLRTTTSTPAMRGHVHSRSRIPMEQIDADDIYAGNIQVAELNSLNACLAVIRWKKLRGFYADTEGEHFSLYTVDANHLLNEDLA